MATIKAVYRYIDEISRSQFLHSQCLLTISVGQEVHEHEKFEATVELVNNSFHSCIMMIDDSLQRHTMVLDRKETAEEFHEFAVEEGNRWLIRNEKYYSKLDNLYQIIRWDKWLNHPQYLSKQTQIRKLMEHDLNYKEIVESSIHEFLRRYCSRLITQADFDQRRAYQLCLDYLIEECTAMSLWPELNCQFEVYPSKRNWAMDETHKRFVLPCYPTLLHPVAIKFKNRKQFKPQQFNILMEQLNEEHNNTEITE